MRYTKDGERRLMDPGRLLDQFPMWLNVTSTRDDGTCPGPGATALTHALAEPSTPLACVSWPCELLVRACKLS